MISEASVPSPVPTRAPDGTAPRGPESPPVRFLGARATEASLVAELAQERHITLELQRAILPLHDTPFDLPGLRTVVIPKASHARPCDSP